MKRSSPARIGLAGALLSVLIVVGCTGAAPTLPPPSTPTAAPSPTPCAPAPIVAPTRPAEAPGYAELDETTGLHVTGIVQELDLESYRLEVTGLVDQPLALTYDHLRCMPRTELRCTLVCPGFFQDEATWAGVPLEEILDLAGLQGEASGLRLVGADGYSAFVNLDDLSVKGSFVAYEWEGEPLPILHGFPVRAVFPALDGNKWVKWLVEIEVV